ncbi:hypothetical protein [Schumannella luteola]
MAAPLPYPLPEGWTVHPGRLARRWPAWFWSAVALGLAVAAGWAVLAASIGWGILFAGLVGAVGAALGVAYQRAGSERGLPRFINAVVLTRAIVRPPDSWVHFFREAGPSRWLTFWFAASGWLALASFVALIVLAARAGGTALWWLALIIPLGLGALVLATAGTIAVVQRIRHSSFGRRPIGISIGRSGVVRYYLDDVDVWPWEAVRGVLPTATVFDKAAGDFSATVELRWAQKPADVSQDEYILDGFESHAWLIYTAIRFWAEHPELRSELSTTFAQRRIESWRDAMLPRP